MKNVALLRCGLAQAKKAARGLSKTLNVRWYIYKIAQSQKKYLLTTSRWTSLELIHEVKSRVDVKIKKRKLKP